MSFILLGILNAQAEAAGADTSFDLIETEILTGTASSVTFSNLNTVAADYKHLQLRMALLGTAASATVGLRINGDTGANYSWHLMFGEGATAGSNMAASQTSMLVGTNPNSSTEVSPIWVNFSDFSNSSKTTTINALGGRTLSTSNVIATNGLYGVTSAVNSITLLVDSGSFAAGARFSIYGLKEAI